MEWRRWARRALVGPEVDSREDGALRIAVTLPRAGRVVRRFGKEATLTALFVYVESQMIPGELEMELDPVEPPSGNHAGDCVGAGEQLIESEVGKQGAPENWWGFKLVLAYPRREIKWEPGKLLREIEGLKGGGGQVVVEMADGGLWDEREGEGDSEEDESDG